MNVKLIKQLFVALFAITLMVSCEYEIMVPEEIILNPDDTISFAAEIFPAFNERGCDDVTSCHGGYKTPNLSGSANDAYQSIIDGGFVIGNDLDNSLIYTYPKPGSGHYAEYTAEQSALIKQWILQGALKN